MQLCYVSCCVCTNMLKLEGGCFCNLLCMFSILYIHCNVSVTDYVHGLAGHGVLILCRFCTSTGTNITQA